MAPTHLMRDKLFWRRVRERERRARPTRARAVADTDGPGAWSSRKVGRRPRARGAHARTGHVRGPRRGFAGVLLAARRLPWCEPSFLAGEGTSGQRKITFCSATSLFPLVRASTRRLVRTSVPLFLRVQTCVARTHSPRIRSSRLSIRAPSFVKVFLRTLVKPVSVPSSVQL